MDIHPHQDILFAADAFNDRMLSFRRDGTTVKQWGSKGSGDGQFNNPRGVAVLAWSPDRGLVQPQDRSLAQSQDRVFARSPDRGLQNHLTSNWIFVADCWNHRIQVFDVDGSFIRKWGSFGQADGQFYFPRGVAVLQKHPTQNLVYVTDSGNNRVQIFTVEGTFVRKWGTKGSCDGQFNYPRGVAVHPTRDLVFICDENHRIQAFRSDGTFLYKWGSEGSKDSADGKLKYPHALALHPTRDLLFVVDSGNYRVQIFDLDGAFVCKWGVQGEGSREFVDPMCISVNPSTDMVYVGDRYRIQVFSLFSTSRKRKYVDG